MPTVRKPRKNARKRVQHKTGVPASKLTALDERAERHELTGRHAEAAELRKALAFLRGEDEQEG